MHARVLTVRVQPDRIDEALHLWQEQVLPHLEQTTGFRDVALYADRQDGFVLATIHYATEADALASQESFAARFAPVAHLFVGPSRHQLYELTGAE
jgi:heme-degrading monooxygenase HmoA